MFAWRACSNALPSETTLAHSVPDFNARWELCGDLQVSDMHTLFDCPQTAQIWYKSLFVETLTNNSFRYVLKAICTIKEVSNDKLGEFIAILWACSNSRNDSLFHKPTPNPRRSISKALDFVKEYNRQFSTSKCREPLLLPPGWHLAQG